MGAAGARVSGTRTSATVLRAVDGDTVEVLLGDGRADVVRLLGVDAPETHHPARPVECYGPEAAAYLQARLAGRAVQLEGDRELRDRYGRRLAHVILDGRRVNDELLRLGYARLLVIPPNRAHGRALLEAELAARRDRAGLWGRAE
ncbi:MAG: thermonuclease family protein [Acidimicrobiia bacterium]|nr:thermonuclease family protein [Acidimicrobiia bacterium]